MSGGADVPTVLAHTRAIMQQAQRMRDNLTVNEDRLMQARTSLTGIDDADARRALASIDRAQADLGNANYGSLLSLMSEAAHLITALSD
ncbi:hypothetical protein [Aestuariimicrobium sp. Y1814]|uniref:hypothetical protein n=1 Tax=Aestuariimicrobium sp. Y1814 TaxID=3418742 RepID=UPI003DA74C8F